MVRPRCRPRLQVIMALDGAFKYSPWFEKLFGRISSNFLVCQCPWCLIHRIGTVCLLMMRKLNIRGVIMLSQGVIILIQGAPVWVGWLSAIICLSLLFTACIIYIRQVWLKLWTSCISWGETGTAKSMEVYFCTTAHLFKGLPGGGRWEKKDNVLKNENFLKVSGAGCCLPGPSSTRPSRDTCFLCLQQVGMELDGKKWQWTYHIYWNPGSSTAMGRTSKAVCFRQ